MNHKLSPNFAIVFLVLLGAIFAAAYWLYYGSIRDIPSQEATSGNAQIQQATPEQELEMDPEEAAMMSEENDIEASLTDGSDFELEMAEIEESMEFEDVDFSDINF